MSLSTFYDGKVIAVPVTAGNNASIINVDDVIVTFTLPPGIRYSGSDLPQGTYDIENDIWDVGTIPASTTLEADSDIYIGDEINISWTVSSINVDPDLVPSNNTQNYNILPINCN